LNKKVIVAILVVVAVVASLILYRLHTMVIVSATLADDKIVRSDGRGAYMNGTDFSQITILYQSILSMDLNSSTRHVYVSFTDAHWKDSDLNDIEWKLPSKDYRMLFYFTAYTEQGPVDILNMRVGEKVYPYGLLSSDDVMAIAFTDPDTGSLACLSVIRRSGITSLWGINITSTDSEPPLPLRNDSFIELTRTSADTWVLDVDAWFASYQRSVWGNFVKYYVKLSLDITLNIKTMI
jgi:hypothetical protein